MKKIAIIGAILALSTSAFADDNGFYAKAQGFGTIGHKLFDDNKVSFGNTVTSDLNKYGEFTGGAGIAAGYQIMDNVRVELQGSYFMGPKWKYDFNGVDYKAAVPAAASVPAVPASTLECEVSAPVGFLNAYVDLIDMGPAKLYVGGGAGISYMDVKTKVTSAEVDAAKNGGTKIDAKSLDVKTDRNIKFSWNVGAGVTFEVSPGISIDVGYSFVDLGKPEAKDYSDDTKKKIDIFVGGTKDDKNYDWQGNNIRAHNVNAG